MKIAVAYNSPAAQVLQHRGPASQEIYPPENVQRIVDALRQNEHEVAILEADQRLIDRLEAFFGSVDASEWPGLVFNLSFGVQGELRYCHVPGVLEMLGLPYVGSGPMGHALSSDKTAAKAIFRHEGLATPAFVEIHSRSFAEPGLGYPLIVKPVTGASSLGLWYVHDEAELRVAVDENLTRFGEPVLVEQFISGREFAVSIIGNDPPEALPLVETVVDRGGPPVYSLEDKDGTAKRRLDLICPARVSKKLEEHAREIGLRAYSALDCRDWARVEMRLDRNQELQLLELNTIPGLGSRSSFPVAARAAGMGTLAAILQRLVEVAVSRYEAR